MNAASPLEAARVKLCSKLCQHAPEFLNFCLYLWACSYIGFHPLRPVKTLPWIQDPSRRHSIGQRTKAT